MFGQRSARVAYGETVVAYESMRSFAPVTLTKGKVYSNHYASYPHDELVNLPYGAKVKGHGTGAIHLLPLTPELWSESLAHRTQILFVADISMIVLQLNLLPGKRVIEAGTGSGALSHAIARAIGSTGHLHTYEFNARRAEICADEFRANGLADRVTCTHANVCEPEWEYPALERASVDAVMFDLPQPWDAIRRVTPLLRPGGILCSFSPCIEQVASTIDALKANGFTAIEVVEVLLRTHEVRPQPPSDALKIALDRAQKARAHEVARGKPSVAGGGAATGGGVEAPDVDGPTAPAAKRARGEGGEATSAVGCCGVSEIPMQCTRPFDDIKGHTGYLLFCRRAVRVGG